MAILCATAVAPPTLAWSLNRMRISQTQERVRQAAVRLRRETADIAALRATTGVICGPGRLPDLVPATVTARAVMASPVHGAWLGSARLAPELFGSGMPTDAWGRCFLLNAAAFEGTGPVWLLSAGPNGLMDTPLNALALGGDDIGERLQ